MPTAELWDGLPTFRFVDVGQGDCMLLTYEGNSVVVDAGPTDTGAFAAEYISLYSPEIDYFIITHPHEDHMGGAADILRCANVEYFVLPDIESGEGFYREAILEAQRQGTEIIYITGKVSYTIENISIEIEDNSSLDYEDLNDASLFIRLTAGSTSCLITGDGEDAAEQYALINYPASFLDCDILKLGHHGSSTSTSEDFLGAVSPEICVISCGKNNSYGHPANTVVSRVSKYGAELRRTDREGTVIIRGKNKGIRMG